MVKKRSQEEVNECHRQANVTLSESNIAILAASQTGVRLDLIALPGQIYLIGENLAVVPAGRVRIGYGAGHTPEEVKRFQDRRLTLTRLASL